uniref:Exportin-5 n=1 Tax=Latimeria chalumnae TaxID=7897 RepID=H3AUW1_LATCH
MSTEQVNSLCEQLMKAVNVMMDPGSSARYRLEALKFCEEFKEKCPICVLCGLKLADKSNSAIVRHFGLQVLEHCVKYRWNSMVQREKVFLKNNVMGLVSTVSTICLLESVFIYATGSSRYVWEHLMRRWEEKADGMLISSQSLGGGGQETQTELVMFILLRLAEDVVTFQTLPTQRRRDIQQTLTQNMEKIFSFLLNILQQNVNKYRRLKVDSAQESKAKAHCRVGIAALNTLAGYIDWVAMPHITAENCRLLEMLCLLLNDPELQLEAAECLLIAVSRKGKLEDRKPLMVLFGDVAMHYILTAAQSADGAGLVERHYIFLKRLCQVLCALGSQLCALLGSDVDIEIPANMGKYLESFLAFTTHPSQFLRSSTQITWGALFRHDVLSQEALLLEMITKYLRASMGNLVKVGFPSKNDSPSCEYSRIDFDGDEDFNAFFNSFRAQQGEVMRMACRLAPMTAFNMAGEWLRYQLKAPVDIGDTNYSYTTAKSGEGLCSIFSPSFVQWDAMTFFTESVISQMFRTMDKDKIPVDEGIELLQAVLDFETKDPLILSCVLTNVSALFPYVTHRTEYLPHVLNKLFASVTFEVVEESKVRLGAAVTCSKLRGATRKYTQYITASARLLHFRSISFCASCMLVCYMSKTYTLLAIMTQQKKLVNRTLLFLFSPPPTKKIWSHLDAHSQQVLWDPELFLRFIGADLTLTDPMREDPCGLNRSRISFCVYTILGVVKRARWPSDLEEAKAGGFVVGYSPSGSPIYRNPCTQQALKLLDNLLALIRTHNNLFLPEMMAKLSETFSKAFEMLEVEKNAILGLPMPLLDLYDSPVYKTVLERMQGFFCTLYDNCFHILGNAGISLQQDFYTIENLAEKLISSAFVNLDNLPDYRLRPPASARVFVKPLVLACPAEYCETLICPILGPLFTYLQQMGGIACRLPCPSPFSELCVPREGGRSVLISKVACLLKFFVLFFQAVCCVMKKGSEPLTTNTEEGEDEEMMNTDSSHSSEELTDLGKALLKQEEICTALLTTAFSALSWKDTLTCQRTTTQLCWPLLKHVMGGSLLQDAVTWFFTSVLRGLQMHGQHDGCMASLVHLAFQIYEGLRPRYAELRTVMDQVPDIHKDSLEQFDSKLMNPALQKLADKRRKDHFKRLLAGCVGKALGQQFRKEVHIKNLPSLFKKAKAKQAVEEKEGSSDGDGTIGLALLFDTEPEPGEK